MIPSICYGPIDHALQQLIQAVLTSNREVRVTVLVSGQQWSGQVVSAQVWSDLLKKDGFHHLDLSDKKDYIYLTRLSEAGTSGVLRLRLDAVQGWWINPGV